MVEVREKDQNVKTSKPKLVEPCSLPDVTSGHDLDTLLDLFSSLRHSPPTLLYRQLCHCIALILIHNGASDTWKIAYYLTEAQAITFRHKALLTWRSKLRKLAKDNTLTDQCSHLMFMRDQLRFDKTPESLKSVVEKLPETWTVCHISEISNPGTQKRHLVITRLTRNKEPLVVSLPGYSDTVQLLGEYRNLLQRSSEAIRVKERAQWWKDRYYLDEEIKTILGRFEHNWLGCWKGLLHGTVIDYDDQQRLADGVNKLIADWGSSTLVADAREKLELLLLAESHLSECELLEGIISLCSRPQPGAVEICERVKSFQKVSITVNVGLCRYGPVILVLDKELQHLPWENFPALQNQQMTRMPSIYFINALYQSLVSNKKSVWSGGVHPNKAFYVVDPDSNLPATRETFADWFAKIDGWHGLVERCPTSKEFREGLSENDLFIYCGHGSGTKYLSQESLETSECRAAVHIMGCSSGKLTSAGRLEASGTMLHYCIAGGPYMMGCLWDVTDRDIDRFTESMVNRLLATRGQHLLDTVSAGRSACRMRYLTGAAPVVYGLPIKIADE